MKHNTSELGPKFELDLNCVDVHKSHDERKMKKALSAYYEVQEDELLLYSGREALLHTLFMNVCVMQEFQGPCYIYEPCSLDYKLIANKFLHKLVTLDAFDTSVQFIEPFSMVMLSNPSFSDGKYHDLEALLKYWMNKKAIIILDESYLDLCLGKSQQACIKEYEFLYLIKDLSCLYHASGIKLCALLGHKKSIEKIEEYTALNTLSVLDMAYVSEALKDKKYKRIIHAINTKNRFLLESLLEKSGLIQRIYKGSTNKVLVQLQTMSAECFIEKYMKCNIQMKAYATLSAYHLQFTLHREDEILHLGKLLENTIIQ